MIPYLCVYKHEGMEFSFFLTDNKTGYKTRDKWLKTNYPEDYDKIINYSTSIKLDLSFKEKIWFYFNQLTERPKCVTCGKEIKFRERFDKPYGQFCTLECINTNKKEMNDRQKKTFNERYGVNFFPQHDDFIPKRKKTKLERYGDEEYNNLEKAKQTKLLKYGDENFNNNQKRIKTSFKKYGSVNYFNSDINKLRLENNFKELYKDIDIREVNGYEITIFCKKCNQLSTFKKFVMYGRLKWNQEVCVKCNPIGFSARSTHEVEITDYLASINVNFQSSVRRVLEKMELDILIPEKNLAIELNGLYWHSDVYRKDNYHLNKTNLCNQKGIELLHIFEDEWLYKRDIVKSIINNRLGINNNSIYARKCEIREVSIEDSRVFLNENHIQGDTSCKLKYGLYNKNELVSLMTFSKGRVALGGKEDEWELIRYCNKLNLNVLGGSGKLFNHFLKNVDCKKIVSYSDKRLFTGGMYEHLGFIRKHDSLPNYWYVINGKRYHRFNYTKKKLVSEGYDENKTERQIMKERKIHRIYDCGNVRWELNR